MKQNATYIEASIHPEKLALTPQSACFPQSELDFGIMHKFFFLHTILANDYK